MKKRIVLLLTTGVLFAGGIFLWTSDTSDAQEKLAPLTVTSSSDGVIKKLDALVSQLSKLTELISTTKNEEVAEDEFTKSSQSRSVTGSIGNPAECGAQASDLSSWPQSYYRKTTSDWNLSAFPETTRAQPFYESQFLDINGDGLNDFIYKYKGFLRSSYNTSFIDEGVEVDGRNQENSCIFLNNGKGWDLVYRCNVNVEVSGSHPNYTHTLKYYGDCADTSQ